MYVVRIAKKAYKQIDFLRSVGLLERVNLLIDILRQNPYQTPPAYEKLYWDLEGKYSRRINQQHRLVYKVNDELHEVLILSMWTHYEK